MKRRYTNMIISMDGNTKIIGDTGTLVLDLLCVTDSLAKMLSEESDVKELLLDEEDLATEFAENISKILKAITTKKGIS